MLSRDPEKYLFNDLAQDDAKRWSGALECQPASGWDRACSNAG